MTPDEYLDAVLREQTLAPGSDELETLRERASEVKELLRNKFSEHSPSVRDAGSHAKKTMVRASYDYDALVYFPSDTSVGSNLGEIYEEVAKVLSEHFVVQRKRSALRLLDPNEHDDPVYFHVDVVPGRFVDGTDGDVFLHQSSGDKSRLKTNPEKHLSHVRESGVRDAIKLAKVWRGRSGFQLPTFVLELLVIQLLDGESDHALEDQMVHVWTELRDRADELTVEDPANSNNDLGSILDAAAKVTLRAAATNALRYVDQDDWEAIFGPVQAKSKEQKEAAMKSAAAAISKPSRPYSDRER